MYSIDDGFTRRSNRKTRVIKSGKKKNDIGNDGWESIGDGRLNINGLTITSGDVYRREI